MATTDTTDQTLELGRNISARKQKNELENMWKASKSDFNAALPVVQGDRVILLERAAGLSIRARTWIDLARLCACRKHTMQTAKGQDQTAEAWIAAIQGSMATRLDRQKTNAGLPGLRSRVGERSPLAREIEHADVFGLDSTERENSAYDAEVEEIYVQAEEDRRADSSDLLLEVLDISGVLADAGSAIVDDSFWKCFASAPADPWNWNFYLLPLWCCGVVVRHFILFPLRLMLLFAAFMVFATGFASVQLMMPQDSARRQRLERGLVQFMCCAFVAAWTGVVRYHGPRPQPARGRVWVSNHTSMIDWVIISSYFPVAVIMQQHKGWVGVLQSRVLNCLGCLYFNRTQVADRQLVMDHMMRHVHHEGSTPLLIFPEGCCVNNEYTVMFKRGAFDLGAVVCPVAIKYNKIFVDAFWNSRKQSFNAHMLKLLSSWAVVCDVYFLEPQSQRDGETAQEFAQRVQGMIAAQAGLQITPWDGYLKYYQLGEKHPQLIEKRRKVLAERLARHFPPELQLPPHSSSSDAAGGQQAKSKDL